MNHGGRKKKPGMSPEFLLSGRHPDSFCFQSSQRVTVLLLRRRKSKQGTLFSCPSAFSPSQDDLEQGRRSARRRYSEVMQMISSVRSSSRLTVAHGSSSL